MKKLLIAIFVSSLIFPTTLYAGKCKSGEVEIAGGCFKPAKDQKAAKKPAKPTKEEKAAADKS